jgi:gamma-glutamylputrescine oxidase
MMPAHVRDAVFWYDRKAAPLPALEKEVRCDVAIVGGGMMGLMCAVGLKRAGRKVCVIEGGVCGSGASGRSSGFITPDSELEFTDLNNRFGAKNGRRLWEFAMTGVELIRQAVADHAIPCDYQVQDALFIAASRKGSKTIAEEHASRAKAGLDCTHVPASALQDVIGATNFFGAVRFGGTFGIDGYRCCSGLRDALIRAGVRVFEQSPVTRILAHTVETESGSVHADAIVVCTDRFLPGLGLAREQIYHVQTFLAMTEPLRESDAKRMFPLGPLLVWDTGLVYNYFRLTGDRRLLIGGGTLLTTYARRERHRPALAVHQFQKYLARHFPKLEVRFDACWPGLIGITKDFAPVIGRHSCHASVHYAGGAAGLPWAAALGNYLAEKIADHRKDFDSLLSADRRFPVRSAVQRIIRKPPAFALSHGILKFS